MLKLLLLLVVSFDAGCGCTSGILAFVVGVSEVVDIDEVATSADGALDPDVGVCFGC